MPPKPKISPEVQVLERKQTNCPLTYIHTNEEYRALNECRYQLIQTKVCRTVYVWDSTYVVKDMSNPDKTYEVGSLDAVIAWFSQPCKHGDPSDNANKDVADYDITRGPLAKSALFIFDSMDPMNDPHGTGYSNAGLTRIIKNARQPLMDAFRSIFFIGHVDEIAPELEHYMEVIRYGLPRPELLRALVTRACQATVTGGSVDIPKISLNTDELNSIVNELKGLTHMEADEALSTANRRNATRYVKGECPTRQFDRQVIREIKFAAIRRSGTMQLMSSDGGLELLGGMGALKHELEMSKTLFCQAAREDGIPMPKGLLMVGPGGTGKSLFARCVGSFLDLQVARLDVGACKGSLMGQSEGNLRAALEMANNLSPIVLFMDEFEKMWAGSASSGVTDGGTTANMLQTWLTWMQDDKDPNVFVVAACNEVRTMPGPVVRAGRFDDIVYVPLPGFNARKQIVSIHYTKNGWPIEGLDIDLDLAAELTRGFSGAEIERVVVKTLRQKAFLRGFGRDIKPTMEDFEICAAQVTPLVKTHPGEIYSLDQWARGTKVIEASDEPCDFTLTQSGLNPVQRVRSGQQTSASNDGGLDERGEISISENLEVPLGQEGSSY